MAVLDKIATKLMPARALRRGLELAECDRRLREAFAMIAAAARAGVLRPNFVLLNAIWTATACHPAVLKRRVGWAAHLTRATRRRRLCRWPLSMTGLNLQADESGNCIRIYCLNRTPQATLILLRRMNWSVKSAQGGSAVGQALLAYLDCWAALVMKP